MARKIHRLPNVLTNTGDSKAKHYLDIKRGLMVPGVAIGVRARGWPDDEIEAIQAARVAGKPTEEIQALVQRLIAARQSAA